MRLGSGSVSARPGVDLQIEDRPSPNFGPRRNGLTPDYVVLHHTAMATSEAAIARLSDPEAQVSSHYVICKTGRVFRLVNEEMRAWHAGAGEWQGLQDMNSRSIGIELDNCGTGPFSPPLMDALGLLLRDVLHRHSIPPHHVIGHSDMAPGRKADPGPYFDWPALERAGLAGPRGTGPVSGPVDWQAFRTRARAVGYTADVDDETLLDAVRLRYRPHATGPLCQDDFVPLPRDA